MTAFGSTVELRLNASSNCAAREGAIVSEQNRGLHASETRLVARTTTRNFEDHHERSTEVNSNHTKLEDHHDRSTEVNSVNDPRLQAAGMLRLNPFGACTNGARSQVFSVVSHLSCNGCNNVIKHLQSTAS